MNASRPAVSWPTTQVLRGALSEKVGQMSKISWRQVSALALAAFFVVGSLSNIFAPGSIYEEYLRWGYPHWFHFVTGSLELTTAVLLARARTRLWGSALGCTVMLAALATVTLHGEYGHGVPPLIVATLSIVVGWIAWRKRLPSFATRGIEFSASSTGSSNAGASPPGTSRSPPSSSASAWPASAPAAPACLRSRTGGRR